MLRVDHNNRVDHNKVINLLKALKDRINFLLMIKNRVSVDHNKVNLDLVKKI